MLERVENSDTARRGLRAAVCAVRACRQYKHEDLGTQLSERSLSTTRARST